MRIAPLTSADIEEALELARRNWAESRFAARLPFDEEKVRANLKRMAEDPRPSYCVFVARDHTGRLVGYLAGSVEEYFFCRRLIASSVFFFVDPKARGGLAAVKLILAFRRWALNRGAAELYIGIATGVNLEKSSRFLHKMGFQFTGGNYSVWLAPGAKPKPAAGPAVTQGVPRGRPPHLWRRTPKTTPAGN
jgi:GNAT superfamily N-acetyltransferase